VTWLIVARLLSSGNGLIISRRGGAYQRWRWRVALRESGACLALSSLARCAQHRPQRINGGIAASASRSRSAASAAACRGDKINRQSSREHCSRHLFVLYVGHFRLVHFISSRDSLPFRHVGVGDRQSKIQASASTVVTSFVSFDLLLCRSHRRTSIIRLLSVSVMMLLTFLIHLEHFASYSFVRYEWRGGARALSSRRRGSSYGAAKIAGGSASAAGGWRQLSPSGRISS